VRTASVSGKRSQSFIQNGRGQRILLGQRHPLRALNEVCPDGGDVIAHGIYAVIQCEHATTIFSPALQAETQASQTRRAGQAADAERAGQDAVAGRSREQAAVEESS